MSILTQTPDFNIPELPVRRFSVDEYHRLIDTGILGEDDKVELLQGLIVPKMSRKPPHEGVLGLTDEALRESLPRSWRVRVQSAITTADSEPEPDIAVVRGPLARYMSVHPRAADIGQLIEVADVSLDKDRRIKGPIYAAAGIPFYWIVNINEQIVEVYCDPAAGYRAHTDYRKGQAVPLILDGQPLGAIAVEALFAGL